MEVNIYNLYIPTSFELISLKDKRKLNELTIILYNKKFSLTLANNNNKIKIDLETYCLKFIKYYNNNINFIFNEANKYLKTFEIYFFIKIKFKGKGFKIKFNKKLRLIKFFFGRSHVTFYKLKKLKLKKINKYKFLLKGLNLSKLKKNASNITKIKPVNVYTLRGIRVSRQYISKRKGKKSSYI
jgi:ribosomal protein L6P/L9E